MAEGPRRWDAIARLATASKDVESSNFQRMIWYAIEPEVSSDPLRAIPIVDALSPPVRRWMARRITEVSTPSTAKLCEKIETLADRPSSAKALIEAIEQNKIPAAELSAEQARQIVALNDKEVLRLLEQVWGSARPSTVDRLQAIKAWQRDLDPSRMTDANLEEGRLVYQKNCGNCHKLFDDGQAVGPDLTNANRQNLGYLLPKVIDPSATVPADFQLTNVLTVDGRIVSGIVAQRSDTSITLQTTTELIQIKSEDIETIKVSSLSMMPDALIDKLSRDQIRDLFAWMMSDGSIPAP